MGLQRESRLQVMLDEAELAVIDDWRFKQRMPSRAAAIRRLITLGLLSQGYEPETVGMRSTDFGVTAAPVVDKEFPLEIGKANGISAAKRPTPSLPTAVLKVRSKVD